MYISQYAHHDAVVLTLDGRLDAEGAVVLEHHLRDLEATPHALTILDLSGVLYINSTGLRVLAIMYKRCQEQGCDLRLAHMTDAVARVVNLAGMDSVLLPYPSVQAAIAG